MMWQPIETAPKDGTLVRVRYKDGSEDDALWREERQCVLASVAHGAGQFGAGWVSPACGYLPVEIPTHWMPLPDPPTREGE